MAIKNRNIPVLLRNVFHKKQFPWIEYSLEELIKEWIPLIFRGMGTNITINYFSLEICFRSFKKEYSSKNIQSPQVLFVKTVWFSLRESL